MAVIGRGWLRVLLADGILDVCDMNVERGGTRSTNGSRKQIGAMFTAAQSRDANRSSVNAASGMRLWLYI